ncbi:MAG: NUDIX domain-containing protein [Chloroflexi bacterium]|nr:NUDIX domain-containing protein [Chloroflexota bacterium]
MRAPFNALVIPFYRAPGAPTLYCVLLRADAGFWQWVAGGGEDSETPAETAVRETREETGIEGPPYALQSQARVPVSAFAARDEWPDDLYVIPEYHFAVEASAPEAQLSAEHTACEWLRYDEAFSRLRFQSNQTALWELAERLSRDELVLA